MTLAELSALWNTTDVWVKSGGAVVAAAAESIFVVQPAGGFEGVLLGFDFWIESEDLATSPMKLVTIGQQTLETNSASLGDAIQSFSAPLTRNGNRFEFPHPYGIPIKSGQAIGLQWKNNEATAQYAWGVLFGIKWTQNQLAGVSGSPTGGPALSGPGLSGSPLGGVFCR